MATPAAERAHPPDHRAVRQLFPLPLVESEKMPPKVAHDLLGLVTIIQGFAELLPELDGKRQLEATRKIEKACRRIVEIVDRSLALEESEVPVLKRQRVDLRGFLGDLLGSYALQARKKGIALRLELGAMSPATIDPGCVERILGNLLANAIKFSCPTSTVILRASVLEGALELAVEDDGPGIPADEIATLFNEHQRGSARPTGGERSSGLGLSIVKDLVHAHRGVIGVWSQIGQGSTFSIRLPLEPDPVYPLPLPILAGG